MERKREKVCQSVQIGRFWHEILAAVLQQVVDIGQLNRPLAFMKVPYRQLHFPDICSSSYSIFAHLLRFFFLNDEDDEHLVLTSPAHSDASSGKVKLNFGKGPVVLPL